VKRVMVSECLLNLRILLGKASVGATKLEGPSWSWASADFEDRIDFWADRDEAYASRVWTKQDAEIMDVKTDLARQSEFGRNLDY